MDGGATIVLAGDRTRHAARELMMRAPAGWTITIEPPTRSLNQSAKFWAICSDIAKSGHEWGGTTHDKIAWHDLILSAFDTVKGRPPRLLIGLEGERVSLVRHTRWLSQSEMADLLDYVISWCALHNVELRQ